MAEGDGYGQQRPETAGSEYNAVSFVIDRAIAKLHTVKIVKVQAVDTDAKTVDVLPLVQQVDGNNQVTSQAKIYGVPYRALLFGTNAVLADPAVDDVGVMVCADRDISVVKETLEESPPGSMRQCDQSDGIYLGGLLSDEEPEQYVEFTDTGMQWHDKNNNNIISNSTGISINGVVFNRSGQVEGSLPITGDLRLSGSVKALNGTSYGGTFTGTDFRIGSGGTLISLAGHWHSANNTAPTPGH